MTDSSIIQQARDTLAKWRKEATAAPWRVDVFGHGGAFVQIVQPAEFQPGYDPNRFDNMDLDIANIEQTAGDARLIVGTAGNPDLLDAIDGLFEHCIRFPAWAGGHMRTYTERIATAIVAADERMSA